MTREIHKCPDADHTFAVVYDNADTVDEQVDVACPGKVGADRVCTGKVKLSIPRRHVIEWERRD